MLRAALLCVEAAFAGGKTSPCRIALLFHVCKFLLKGSNLILNDFRRALYLFV